MCEWGIAVDVIDGVNNELGTRSRKLPSRRGARCV